MKNQTVAAETIIIDPGTPTAQRMRELELQAGLLDAQFAALLDAVAAKRIILNPFDMPLEMA